MYDDNYAAAAAAVRAGQADEDEDDFILQQDPDKPGFVSWAEALSTRHFSQADKCSIGYWDEAQSAVALTKCRGKKQLVMGYSIGGTRYLDPDEALYLVDDGQLQLLARHPHTGADLRPGMSRIAATTAPISDGSGGIGHTSAAIDGGGTSVHVKMAMDGVTGSIPSATVHKPATAGPAGVAPKWKSNDDLLEQLERQMEEDEAEADAADDGDAAEGEDEEDSYDEEEEAEMRGASGSSDGAGPRQSASRAAGPPSREGAVGLSGGSAVDASAASAAAVAAAVGKEEHLSLPSAYAFLLQHVRLPEYLVYLHLRSTGLVALRHRPQAVLPAPTVAAPISASAAAAAAAGISAATAAATGASADGTQTLASSSEAVSGDAAVTEAETAPLTPAPVLLHAAGQERWLAAPATQACGSSTAGPSTAGSSSADASFCSCEPSTASSSAGGAAGVCGSCSRVRKPAHSLGVPSVACARKAGDWLTTVEPDVHPIYDAYARDGITSFKPSAPGPPDFYVCVQTADQPPPTPAQVLRLSERLARHMAALRERQRARGVACLPSFSEVGGGGGVSGAMMGKGASHMSRVVAGGGGSGGAPADGSAADGAGAQFSPNIKVAIVAHTAITFFTATPVELRLPQRFLPRMGGAPMALVSGAAAMAAPGAAEAAQGGSYPYGQAR